MHVACMLKNKGEEEEDELFLVMGVREEKKEECPKSLKSQEFSVAMRVFKGKKSENFGHRK